MPHLNTLRAFEALTVLQPLANTTLIMPLTRIFCKCRCTWWRGWFGRWRPGDKRLCVRLMLRRCSQRHSTLPPCCLLAGSVYTDFPKI